MADLDDFVGVAGIEFDVKDVDISKALEQDGLAFHHRLAGERPDVAQAEHRRAIAYDTNQVAAGGVFESVMRIPFDLETRISNPGRVGQAEIALGTTRLGGRYFDLPGRAPK